MHRLSRRKDACPARESHGSVTAVAHFVHGFRRHRHGDVRRRHRKGIFSVRTRRKRLFARRHRSDAVTVVRRGREGNGFPRPRAAKSVDFVKNDGGIFGVCRNRVLYRRGVVHFDLNARGRKTRNDEIGGAAFIIRLYGVGISDIDAVRQNIAVRSALLAEINLHLGKFQRRPPVPMVSAADVVHLIPGARRPGNGLAEHIRPVRIVVRMMSEEERTIGGIPRFLHARRDFYRIVERICEAEHHPIIVAVRLGRVSERNGLGNVQCNIVGNRVAVYKHPAGKSVAHVPRGHAASPPLDAAVIARGALQSAGIPAVDDVRRRGHRREPRRKNRAAAEQRRRKREPSPAFLHCFSS